MGFGFVPNWLHQVSPLLHKTTLTAVLAPELQPVKDFKRTGHACLIMPHYAADIMHLNCLEHTLRLLGLKQRAAMTNVNKIPVSAATTPCRHDVCL